MNPLNPTPQEQEEKRGEGARADKGRYLTWALLCELGDSELPLRTRNTQHELEDAFGFDPDHEPAPSSSPASSDTETDARDWQCYEMRICSTTTYGVHELFDPPQLSSHKVTPAPSTTPEESE